jgi:methylated-DNA-[protein]-cysteine S-methyltransferase
MDQRDEHSAVDGLCPGEGYIRISAGEETGGIRFRILSSAFGEIAVVWSQRGDSPVVLRVILPRQGIDPRCEALAVYRGATEASCRLMDEIASMISAFCEGARIDFGLDIVGLDLCSPFQRKVLLIEHAIPYGSVSTYGRIAARAGDGAAARAVGNALSRNPFPIIIPCHRAVCSDMSIGGYQGGREMKRSLLENEGHSFDSRMRLSDPRIFY